MEAMGTIFRKMSQNIRQGYPDFFFSIWPKTRDEDPDPNPVGSGDLWPIGSGSSTFSTDPDPDPTCNNGFITLFLS